MSAEIQRLATIVTSTAQLINELAREVPLLAIDHDCITGQLSAHVRSYADLQQLPGEEAVAEISTVDGLCRYRASKQFGDMTFFTWTTAQEVASNED
mgnify:CR=1 FL=1